MKPDTPFVLVGNKIVRLYKRGEKEDSPWWFRVQQKGKRVGVSTATTDTETALKVAKEIAEEAAAGRWTKAEGLIRTKGGKLATIGQVLKLADPKNAHRLIELVIIGTGKKDIVSMSTDTLTRALVGAFQAKCQGLHRPDYDLPHEDNGSANATLRHAKAVFAKKAMLQYEAAGLNLPDLDGFLTAPELQDPTFRYSESLLTPARMQKIVAALPELKLRARELYRDFLKVALTGAPSERPRDLAAWLKPLGATVEQVRWHCGAVWFKKTGSLKLVAEKLNISYGWAHWHYNRMKTGKVELAVGEL